MRALCLLIALCLTACAADPARKISVAYRQLVAPPARVIDDGESMRVHLEQRRALRDLMLQSDDDDDADVEVLTAVQVTGSRISPVSITNTQETSVDEGGLIKYVDGHLIVLRDGWLFVVAIDSGETEFLRLVDRINLREQPDSDKIWFDELISYGSHLAVLGYDFSSEKAPNAEVRSFSVALDGRLTVGERIQMRSDDYFSGHGYGMRVRGNELLMQLSRWMSSDLRPSWPEWRRFGEEAWRPLVDRADVYVPDFIADEDVLHTYLRCNLPAFAEGGFECRGISVIAGLGAEPYYTDEALYVGFAHPDERRFTDAALARLQPWELRQARSELARTTVMRIPRSGAAPVTSARLRGGTWSGFDFKLIDDRLHVATTWQDETLLHILTPEAFSPASSALVTATGSAPGSIHYRRFSDHALWVGGEIYHPQDRHSDYLIWMLPLDGRPARSEQVPCCMELLQPVADSMIVLGDMGCWSDNEHVWLRAFGNDLKQRAVVDHPGRCLPESRAQSVNFAAQPEGESIVMVWPTAEVIRSPTEERPVAMHFLTLNGDEVKETGIVPMDDGPAPVPTESNDWYGNTRTVIIGERIFLLSGDLLKEVRHSTSGVREVGRVALPRQTDD